MENTKVAQSNLPAILGIVAIILTAAPMLYIKHLGRQAMEVIGFGNLIFYLSFALMGGVLALVGTGISIGKLRGNNDERKWAKFGLVLNISVVLFWAYILSVDIRPNQSLHPIAPRKSGQTNQ